MRDFPIDAHRGLTVAISKGIAREPRWRARLNSAWLTSVIEAELPIPAFPDRQRFDFADRNPLSMRTWENTRGLIAHPGGTDPWLVELARQPVEFNTLSVVKSFEQVLEHADIEDPIHFSQSGNWGRPFIFPVGLAIRWYFRLSPYNGASPPWINVFNPAPQDWPGEPHFDISEMQDLWFPAGSPPTQSFHMLIGGGYLLRILALVELDAEYDLSIAAKIRGYSVGAYGVSSQLAIRSLW